MSAEDLIPSQEEGIQTNTESSREFASEEETKDFFKIVKQRMKSVNQWHQLAGRATADFQLTDEKGNEVNREPAVGDHFRIKIPAPASKSGEGFDWVKVEDIAEDERSLAIQVRPCSHPEHAEEEVAHFFADSATSSFLVKQEGKTITAGVYGRNEKPNLQSIPLADKIRNAAVATGAISGFAKIQWKSLVNALVSE